MSPEKNFTEQQLEQVVSAIREAELNTSGEIRIHIENHCKKDPLDRAVDVFAELDMHKTALRNGVLIYLALADHQLAIIGDAGINATVDDDYWDEIKNKLVERMKRGEITEGLSEAVLQVGEQLKASFPYQDGDINELPDEISFNH